MNRWIHKCAALLVTASALVLTLEAAAEEKVQKITFIEDDAQKNMASKIYVLKYTKAADIADIASAAGSSIAGNSMSFPVSSHVSQQLVLMRSFNSLYGTQKSASVIEATLSPSVAMAITPSTLPKNG